MRPIDKDVLVREFAEFVRRSNNSDFAPVPTWNDAVALLACAPTIEAEPVVRCKDCKHYQFANNRAFGMIVKHCEITGFEDVDDFDFCSRAERSE